MFSLVEQLKVLFSVNNVRIRETLKEINATFQVKAKMLPEGVLIQNLFSQTPSRDKWRISFSEMMELSCTNEEGGKWIEKYKVERDYLEADDLVSVEISIEKQNVDNAISVYSFQALCAFLSELKIREVLDAFSAVLSQHNAYVNFHVLDCVVCYQSKYIRFSNEKKWYTEDRIIEQRKSELAMCEDASAFLNRQEMALLPQDFMFNIIRGVPEELVQKMKQIATILSHLYLANSSYINDDRLVLQYNTGSEYVANMSAVSVNENICNIYKWAFSGDTAVERAAIARNVMKLYCKDIEEYLGVSENVFYAIKSNYSIYQRNSTQQYIEMKNKVGDYLVSLSQQLQDMMTEVTNGIRNNIVAIVTFWITVILTGAVDIDLLKGDELPGNFRFVSWIFIGASVVYMVLTWIASNSRRKTIDTCEEQLKKNYADILDSKDIEELIDKNVTLQSAKKRIVRNRRMVFVVWCFLITAAVVCLLVRSNQPVKEFILYLKKTIIKGVK